MREIINTSLRCLVLGGGGFIGSHLVDALIAQGNFVRCFERPHVVSLGEGHASEQNFELFEGDFVSEADIEAALEGCDICFHLVSTTQPKSSNADPVFDVESNLLGTIRLLNHAVKNGLKKIVFVSSGGTVYGNPLQTPIPETHPTNPICSYGITKLSIEKYLGLYHELHGLDYTVLRLSNPFGERQRTHANQGVVAVFLGKAIRGETIEIWGDGSVVRDYMHIHDVVSALLAALDFQGAEHTFNIGSGIGLSLNDVISSIEKITNRATVCRYVKSRRFDVPANVLAIDRAASLLGWSPRTSFEEGLMRFAKWLEDHPHA
jgi:UDP-glucose 4-epimerase